MREAPVEVAKTPSLQTPQYIDVGDKSLVEILENEILPRIDAEEFYGSYLKLKASGKNLKALCPFPMRTQELYFPHNKFLSVWLRCGGFPFNSLSINGGLAVDRNDLMLG